MKIVKALKTSEPFVMGNKYIYFLKENLIVK